MVTANCWGPGLPVSETRRKSPCNLSFPSSRNFRKLSIKDEKLAKQLQSKIYSESFNVSDVVKKNKNRSPYSPFSNSLLLQDASSKLGFSPKYTNSLAQQLKDGISGHGALITYHRSDSNRMKKDEIDKLRDLIGTEIGKEYLPEKSIHYNEKSKFVQQGHEAVTPTQLNVKPESVKNILNQDQFKLYDLIWKRTVASQMNQSKNLETTYFIKGESIILKSSGSVPIFDGFKKIKSMPYSIFKSFSSLV